MKRILLVLTSLLIPTVWGGFIDTYDECNQALDVCWKGTKATDRSAASACVDAGGIWTGQKCPQYGGDWCKNKCHHKVTFATYITTAKGCGICHFDQDSIDSAYSKAGQFKAGTDVPFAATFVHKKLCNVKVGAEAISYAFDQEHTDSNACEWLYWRNKDECPRPGDDSTPYNRPESKMAKISTQARFEWIMPSSTARLSYITAAPNGTLWGVNAVHEVYMSTDKGLSWRQPNVTSRIGLIAVAPDNTLWGIEGALLYQSKNNGALWEPVNSPLKNQKLYKDAGSLVDIAVAPNQDLWAITKGTLESGKTSYHIFRSSDGAQTWEGPLNGILKEIAVAPNGDLWGVNAADIPFVSKDNAKTWQGVGGRLSYITVQPNGVLWGVNAAGNIFASTDEGKTWKGFEGLLKQIAFAPDGALWGVNGAGQIYINPAFVTR